MRNEQRRAAQEGGLALATCHLVLRVDWTDLTVKRIEGYVNEFIDKQQQQLGSMKN